MNLKQLGLKIQELRNKRGLSQETLAQQASVARGALQQLESGQGNPTMQTILAVAGILKFEVSFAEPAPIQTKESLAKEVAQEVISALRSPTEEYRTNRDLQKLWSSWKSAGPLIQSVVLYLITKTPEDRARVHKDLQFEVDRLAEHIRLLQSL